MLHHVPAFNDCVLTCTDLDVRSQTGTSLGILTLVILTGIASSAFCCLLLHCRKKDFRHPDIRTALKWHSFLDFLFLIWFMTLVCTLRLSLLDDCKACRAVYLGVMRMGRSVLTTLRNWIAVWIGFQRYRLTCRPSGTRMATDNFAHCRPAYRGAYILIAVLVFNLPEFLDYVLLQCNRGDSRLVLFQKVHVLGRFVVIVILPLCLLIFFSQQILVRIWGLIDLYRHCQPPMPGTMTHIRLSCLQINRLLLAFMFCYVVLSIPGVWYVIQCLINIMGEEDCRLDRPRTMAWITSAVCACLTSTTDFMMYFLFWPTFRRLTIDFARSFCQILVRNPCNQ
ncbi:unnamed protein product [Dibothriocephalus latus]|uniref:G-protein coupled receptors family 1 profile domain-containing protein n=1 Tax=Dibothriocephalus latus TaxID=60516 RepID=A0A3P7L8H5_DIBLA|nr:unnamed protein product [Dibothriocephalus latus]